jgi:TetR/AcrR family transcriptional regulator, transcriptional repressor of aconitase
MPKISEEKRQARRDQILAASWKCFSRRGIRFTSMDDIVKESNLSFGAVYLYYKSKDELIQAAFSAAAQVLQSFVVPIVSREPALPPAMFVREMAKGLTAFANRDELNFGVSFLMGWGEAEFNSEIKAMISDGQTKYRDLLIAVVRKWQKTGEISARVKAEVVGSALFSFILGFIVQSAMLGDIAPDAYAKGFEGLFSGTPPPRQTRK